MTEAATHAAGSGSHPPRNRSLRGAAVCLAMFALGGAVLWGLFLAPRGSSPASPAVPWGTPFAPLRFVALEFDGQPGVADALVKQVRDLDPDYVLVQNIRFDDVLPLAESLGMARSYHPQLFQRPDPRSKDAPGALILSKHDLYDARPMVLGTGPYDRGVQATTVLGNVRFAVASGVGATDDSLRSFEAARKQAGSRPTVLATGFVKPMRGEGAYRGDLLPTVALTQDVDQGSMIVPVATVYADPSWVMTAGHADGAAGRMVLYVQLKAWTPDAAAATKPWR